MKEIDPQALQDYLNSSVPFEMHTTYRGHLLKCNFMGDEYVQTEFGSWWPL